MTVMETLSSALAEVASLRAEVSRLRAFARNYLASQDFCVDGREQEGCECSVCVLNREAHAALRGADE